MTTIRSALRHELTERLLPVLRNAGFRGPSKLSGNALVYEFRRAGTRGCDVLAVQFEKHGLPRFVLNVHVEPPESIQSVIARGGTIITGSVKPTRGMFSRSWFRADPTFWQRLRSPSRTLEKEAVAACAALLPEIEAWWTR